MTVYCKQPLGCFVHVIHDDVQKERKENKRPSGFSMHVIQDDVQEATRRPRTVLPARRQNFSNKYTQRFCGGAVTCTV